MAQITPLECARLTGQRIYTMEVFRPLRNIWNRIGVLPPVAVSAAGVSWLSRFVYNYPHLMLLDLSPRSPATLNWPLYNYPPPHFLIGYEYMIRVFNNYVFDVRTYSRITYLETRRQGVQLLDWLCLATSSYTVDVGAYRRFMDEGNFEEQALRIHQSILFDRIMADLAMQRQTAMEGLGLPEINNPIPVSLQQPMRHCSPSSWGFSEHCRLPPSAQPPEEEDQNTESAATILDLIARIRSAYFCFLLHALASSQEYDLPPQIHIPTPWSLPENEQWFPSWLRFYTESQEIWKNLLQNLPIQNVIPLILDSLSLPNHSPALPQHAMLHGGAVLRPRENGRAVTASMLRRRGEAVINFIESLPFPTRRRRPRPPPSPEVEEEDIEEENFVHAIRRVVQEIIEALQEELTDHARQQQFFSFTIPFYATLERLIDDELITESVLRRWMMYFFITEHVATTLNYLHHELLHRRLAQRHINLEMTQIIMRARDEEGNLLFSRVFSELGYDSMTEVMQRLVRELTASVPHAGRGEVEQGEVASLMEAIEHPEDSGDIADILKQFGNDDSDVDSVELSFRFRLSGPVVFTQNQQIQTLTRRVSQEATRLRQAHLPMPNLNQVHALPPGDVPARRQ
ncbi:TP [Murine adenovirus 3]|uniref:TP n=1 Tax=Murine adenovirus 3 TaxID=573199 RepID=C3SAT9_9ADEN|nr:TP [Murine adenovirus 3]ACJ14509.1 TP [Murine adenovirus 3]